MSPASGSMVDMYHHRLVLDGRVIRIFVDSKLATLRLNVHEPSEIRAFMHGKVPDAEIERRLQDLMTQGEIQFTA